MVAGLWFPIRNNEWKVFRKPAAYRRKPRRPLFQGSRRKNLFTELPMTVSFITGKGKAIRSGNKTVFQSAGARSGNAWPVKTIY